ncbi:hypothetical protein D3C73_932050 [compost metagenome]
MAVDALEDNPLAVDGHQLVLQLETAEASLLDDGFNYNSLSILKRNAQRVQIRQLCAPRLYIRNSPC